MNKLAILSPWYISKKSIGGTERYILDLALSIKNLGYQVDIFMLSGSSYTAKGINFISLNLMDGIIIDEYILKNSFGTLDNEETFTKFAKLLEDKINVSNYDAIQINSPYFLKCWENKKRVFTIHSNEAEMRVLYSEKEIDFIKLIMRQQAQKNMHFVVPSKAYLQHWKSILGQNTVSIPHSLNTKRLRTSFSKQEISHKYKLSENKINILLPNRLEPRQKRPLLFVESIFDIDKNIKQQIQVIFTGVDLQYKQYINKIKSFCIKNEIDAKFVKFDNIAQGYKIADIVVIPSKFETFGYSAIEALFYNKPTVLSSIPTFLEIGANCNNAYYFKSKKQLKNSLLKILNKKTNKNNSKEIILSNYNINNWAKIYEKLFFVSS